MIRKDVQEQLIKMEKSIYSAYQEGKLAAIETMLAEDFHEIGSSGRFYRKADVLDAMKSTQVIDYRCERFDVLSVDENCAIVTYLAAVKRIEEGRERLNQSFRSSTWVRRKGSWRIIFHQATPLTSANSIPE